MQSEKPERHTIHFVGAGPGDPDLITVKGRRALARADLVIFAGSLVPEALLRWTQPSCECIDSAPLHLDDIVALMKTAYRRGKRVVRLHTGDPSLYGAVFEQMAALAADDIPCAVIPGVTAAFAAAAALGIEYTLPEVSQTLILTRMAGRTPVPESEDLGRLAAHRASMAIYLSISMVDRVQQVLAAQYGADAPCAVVYRASHPDEKTVRTVIGRLAETVHAEQITRQAVIVVGKVLSVSLDRLEKRSRLYDKHFAHGFRGHDDG